MVHIMPLRSPIEVYRATAYGPKSLDTYQATGPRAEHNPHLETPFAQEANEFRRFVGSDPGCDAEDNTRGDAHENYL